MKKEAASIFRDVGAALADGDEKRLRELTTPLCFATMQQSLRTRPKGQRHQWGTVGDVEANVKQMRIGHQKSKVEQRFAQVTCLIKAKLCASPIKHSVPQTGCWRFSGAPSAACVALLAGCGSSRTSRETTWAGSDQRRRRSRWRTTGSSRRASEKAQRVLGRNRRHPGG